MRVCVYVYELLCIFALFMQPATCLFAQWCAPSQTCSAPDFMRLGIVKPLVYPGIVTCYLSVSTGKSAFPSPPLLPSAESG